MYKFDDGKGKYGPRRDISVSKCDVRLDRNEAKMLDELADRNGVTRSDVMRRALRDYHRFNTDGAIDVTRGMGE